MRVLEAGALNALQIFAMVIIIGFFWRYVQFRYKDHPIGQAMAFVY